MSTYGFGPAVQEWGGFLADVVCVPFARHMLVPLPEEEEDDVVPSSESSPSHAVISAVATRGRSTTFTSRKEIEGFMGLSVYR